MNSVPTEPAFQQFFKSLAQLSRERNSLEVKLLIEIVALDGAPISTRELAGQMKVSRRHLIEARNSLECDGLITCERNGPAERICCRAACFPELLVRQVPGAESAPPDPPPGARAAPPRPEVEPNRHHPGAEMAPPANGFSASSEPATKEDARASNSTCSLREQVFDRLRKAQNPQKVDDKLLEKWGSLMHSLFAKWESEAAARPPDRVIVAKLAALLVKPDDESRLEHLYYELLAKRWQHPPASYAYLVFTAAHRLHRIPPEELRPAMSPPRKPAGKEFAEELLAQAFGQKFGQNLGFAR